MSDDERAEIEEPLLARIAELEAEVVALQIRRERDLMTRLSSSEAATWVKAALEERDQLAAKVVELELVCARLSAIPK